MITPTSSFPVLFHDFMVKDDESSKDEVNVLKEFDF